MILLFIISFLILVIFLSWKSWEIYKGKNIISPDILEKSDDWLKEKLSNLIIFFYKKNKRMMIFLRDRREKVGRKFFVLWYKFIDKVELGLRKLKNSIKGRYLKKSNGQASSFLKDISEYKKSLTKE